MYRTATKLTKLAILNNFETDYLIKYTQISRMISTETVIIPA